MGVVNRRNIALGVAAYKLTKALQGLRATPEPEPEPEPPKGRGRKLAVLAAGVVVVAGALAFLRSR